MDDLYVTTRLTFRFGRWELITTLPSTNGGGQSTVSDEKITSTRALKIARKLGPQVEAMVKDRIAQQAIHAATEYAKHEDRMVKNRAEDAARWQTYAAEKNETAATARDLLTAEELRACGIDPETWELS